MSAQPNATLYINNLNEKVKKEELRSQLYALFTTYGRIIDIVASKTPSMRGQAFLVFSDLTGATAALRACEGMLFYDKPMNIAYAKTASYATMKRQDPNFVPPNAPNVSAALKRPREEDAAATSGPPSKKKSADESSDEEMEIDDEDEEKSNLPTYSSEILPPQVHVPTARLLCTNLPGEVTDDVLTVLFEKHDGFISLRVVTSPTPKPNGDVLKVAQVLFKTSDLATPALNALNGFPLKKGWTMTVVYI
ncbi:RNA-binding domain-containing protein [Cylindrobasidium torrendii FP15055 ss-10]|uniref:RNA-binding domain-containing protein n=1 Tax=Cylindrobasidium torrendii FP15055 ss-10 TaxID=1314674 RepID=A0A0D7BVS8_9AGAR|nr:RNA-binding domain-containing protein [Cylindrobasidium torrendii FP15055 ss-10]